MSEALDVYLSTVYVGSLHLDDKRQFVFKYHASWIVAHQSQPLSLSLQVREEPYYGASAQSFFC